MIREALKLLTLTTQLTSTCAASMPEEGSAVVFVLKLKIFAVKPVKTIIQGISGSRPTWSNCGKEDHQDHTTTVLRPFFRDHPGEPVPEENFWTLWCKGRFTEADTLTIRLGTTPSGLTSAHLHHLPIFLRAGCPSCRPTNSVKALKATSAFGLGRRR